MSKPRASAHVVVFDNELWISGGYNMTEHLHEVWIFPVLDDFQFKITNDIEIITKNGEKKSGVILPPNHQCQSSGELYTHQMISINETFSMLIGGICGASGIFDDWNSGIFDDYDKNSTKLTFYFNHLSKEWSQGPDLLDPEFRFGAGVLKDKVTKEEMVAVYKDIIPYTAVLKKDSKEWIIGN